MRIQLDYGDHGLDVDVPSTAVVIHQHASPPLTDLATVLTRALQSPLASPRLGRLVASTSRIAVAVCDGTRPQPRREMLAALLSELPDVPPDRITIFVATGTHRGNTAAELEQMLGREIMARHRVVNHDARDDATLAPAGTTRSGVAVLLNREFLAADVRITTGVVEPHFFAGFSGGPKMVAPGLAGLSTVLDLHDAARIGHPGATWGAIEGNPVQDDIRDIAGQVGVHFALDVTLNRDKGVTAAFAGNLFAEHRAACERARQDAICVLPEAFDVVLTSNSGFPLDQNLYQAVKGLSAAARIVKPGGTIVCAAECRDGVPSHGAFAQLLTSRHTPRALLETISSPGFRMADQWQVQILAGILQKARVMFKADGVTATQLRAAHLEPVDEVSEAVARALERAGPGAALCVLPQGPRTIAVLESTRRAPQPDA